MFRRKEEGLFDNVTEGGQASAQQESANVVSNPQIPAQHAHSSSNAAPASAYSPAAPTAPRPVAGGFRASSPLSGDITRNRMPEAKPAVPAVPSERSGKAPGRRVLTVGNDILLKGEIATCDRLVIEGKVDASLNDVHTVEIAENGSFKGSAHIEDAEISGIFEGDLVVRNRLVIYATGKVRGKISYGEIEIERGGELTGEIKTTTSQGQASQAPRPRQNAPKDDKVAA